MRERIAAAPKATTTWLLGNPKPRELNGWSPNARKEYALPTPGGRMRRTVILRSSHDSRNGRRREQQRAPPPPFPEPAIVQRERNGGEQPEREIAEGAQHAPPIRLVHAPESHVLRNPAVGEKRERDHHDRDRHIAHERATRR